jgi:hypothetical protein
MMILIIKCGLSDAVVTLGQFKKLGQPWTSAVNKVGQRTGYQKSVKTRVISNLTTKIASNSPASKWILLQ